METWRLGSGDDNGDLAGVDKRQEWRLSGWKIGDGNGELVAGGLGMTLWT